ncbi:DUF547 domain-containing protein [Rapidithrix thailandica]|uniref:DUF547 domain-containing protein n=1 Tax=Rapidithrix thailandica TaxID=413964 RepID=A0AAW9S7E9_9BACT
MRWILWMLLAGSLAGCFQVKYSGSDTQPVEHSLWNALLHQHVSPEGKVDYQGFMQDSLRLQRYLTLISSGFPNDKYWSENEQLAYWINAYNAFTIQLILKNYPVQSIKEIGPKLSIPFVNSVFDIEFIRIGDQLLSLNHIEHGILRKRFEEPRIHFAINCASVSCPDLRPEAYTAEQLEEQLHQQAVRFINDPQKNQLSEDQVRLSKIFQWFESDFTRQGSLLQFINRYAQHPVNTATPIRFLNYNWHLNE